VSQHQEYVQHLKANSRHLEEVDRYHWVAVSPDRDPEPVRRFGCFTADLREMARWLPQLKVA
jgi:hypothetical protein